MCVTLAAILHRMQYIYTTESQHVGSFDDTNKNDLNDNDNLVRFLLRRKSERTNTIMLCSHCARILCPKRLPRNVSHI